MEESMYWAESMAQVVEYMPSKGKGPEFEPS
jgi:hypothetical protein